MFLIPANSKKSLLIFGVFDLFDLILFASGLGVSILLLLIVSPSSLLGAIVDIAPVLITGFLVLPIPNYRNTRILIRGIQILYKKRKIYLERLVRG